MVKLAKRTLLRHTPRMTLRLAVLVVAVSIATAAAAAETKLPLMRVGTKAYTNVVVIGINATDLYFRHKGGIANVKLKYLAPDLQKQFNYNAVSAAEAEKQQLLDEARFAESLAHQIEAEVKRRAPKDELPPELTLAEAVSDRAWLNKKAPDLTVEKWLGEKPDTKNRFVLVNFWGTWSAPCRRLIPELNAYHKKYGEQLVIIGLTAETEKTISQMSDPKIDYFQALDTKSKLVTLAGATSVPYVMFIDPKGVVRYQGHPAAITDRFLQAIFKRFAPE